LLIPAANYGVAGTVLGALSPEGRTLRTETSALAARLCESNLATNGVDGAVSLAPTLADATDDHFDVLAYAPRVGDSSQSTTRLTLLLDHTSRSSRRTSGEEHDVVRARN
jgi:16S rRNA G1207 methylase RsmC